MMWNTERRQLRENREESLTRHQSSQTFDLGLPGHQDCEKQMDYDNP